LILTGCLAPDDRDSGDGPGSKPWKEEELGCESDADCGAGERCEAGSCRLARCIESYASKPPLGSTHFFGVDGEIVVVSDNHFLDLFEPQGGEYIGSWEAGAPTIADVADGNFDGTRPRGMAVALQGQTQVELHLGSGTSTLSVGLAPIAIGAGDIDGDGLDELVAVAQGGALAICDVDTKQCTPSSVGTSARDVSVGDVDGDGFAEAVVLAEPGDSLVVWNHDAAKVTQELGFTAQSVAAGDLDGDGTAETTLFEDRGWLGFASDRLHVLSGPTVDVSGSAVDVAAGDRDADGRAELALLRDDHQVEMLRLNAGNIVPVGVVDVVVGTQLQAIAVLDWDGDSASGELIEGPVLVSGDVVPTLAVGLPPYPEGYTDGSSGVWVGESKEVAVSASHTVSLELGVMMGVGFESPVLEASVGVSLSHSIEVSTELSSAMSVAQYFHIDGDPDRPRDTAGGVVVACGCYHRYRYRTYDPRGTVGGSEQTVDIFVPVGGQTQMWSTTRYNAMARATGMPVIEIPYRLGDVASYPTAPSTIEGTPVATEDLLFPELPLYQASELANVEFWLNAGESVTNEAVETTSLGTKASFGAAGIEVELSAEVGLSRGYSIAVGNEALFIGWIPPLPDDPETPEDEHELYQYGFSPLVYRQRYTDVAGQEAGYYVLGYSVAP